MSLRGVHGKELISIRGSGCLNADEYRKTVTPRSAVWITNLKRYNRLHSSTKHRYHMILEYGSASLAQSRQAYEVMTRHE